jgi:hypothetical protein
MKRYTVFNLQEGKWVDYFIDEEEDFGSGTPSGDGKIPETFAFVGLFLSSLLSSAAGGVFTFVFLVFFVVAAISVAQHWNDSEEPKDKTPSK